MKKKITAFILLILTVSLFFMGITTEAALEYKEENIDTKEPINRIFPEDIKIYISIPNTEFKVGIAQFTNNSYYLNHDLKGNKDIKGTPFLDYRDNYNTNILRVYGHNSSTIKTEFNYLEHYYDQDFYNKNKYIIVETPTEDRKYEIFSLYTETSDWSYYNVDFTNEVILKNELEKYKGKSDYDTKVNINGNEDILILQTCSYKKEFKKYKNKYYLIIAKRIE